MGFNFRFSLSCVLAISMIAIACSNPKTNAPAIAPSAPLTEAEIYQEQVQFLPNTEFPSTSFPKSLITTAPTGTNRRPVADQNCAAENLRRLIVNAPKEKTTELVQDFVSKCSPTWESPAAPYAAMFGFVTTSYSYTGNRKITYLRMRLENGVIIRGMLGVKPGSKPRPLIIAACGITCDAGNNMSLYMMMQLFDESPFHVLVISNSFSKTFAKDNGQPGLGGINGGETVLRLARYFRNPQNPMASKISDVHVFGASLGSHEALYATLLNAKHIEAYGRGPIQSTLAICPVVDYPETTRLLLNSTILGKTFSIIVKKILKQAYEAIPALKTVKTTDYEANLKLYFENEILFQRRFRKTEPWNFPLFTSGSQLVEYSRFENHIPSIKTPTLLWGSADDPIVKSAPNVEKVSLDGDMNPFVNTIESEMGGHCALAMVYGWKNISLAFQSYFLGNSPEFKKQLREYRISLDRHLNPRLLAALRKYRTLSYYWSVAPSDDTARLYVKLDGRVDAVIRGGVNLSDCRNPENDVTTSCSTIQVAEVPLAKLPNFVQNPITSSEAEASMRWLNVQVKVLGEDGQDITGQQALPTAIEFVEL